LFKLENIWHLFDWSSLFKIKKSGLIKLKTWSNEHLLKQVWHVQQVRQFRHVRQVRQVGQARQVKQVKQGRQFRHVRQRR